MELPCPTSSPSSLALLVPTYVSSLLGAEGGRDVNKPWLLTAWHREGLSRRVLSETHLARYMCERFCKS